MSRSWNRRVFLRAAVVTAAAGASAATMGTASGAPRPPGPGPGAGRLRVERTTAEYAEELLGTDTSTPHLGWELAAGGRGAAQSAYQVRVAVDARDLSRRPLWDSGRVVSARSVNVPYAGPELRPRTRYHWQVRVWDEQGRASSWSAVRWWETALPADGWRARWIGAEAAPEAPGFDGASWIWSAGATSTDAPAGPRWFRADLELPAGAEVSRATVVATADDDFTLHLGGQQVLHAPEQTDGWRTGRSADVTEQVRASGGRIVVAAVATNRGNVVINPGGLLVRLEVETADGRRHQLVTGNGWRVEDAEQDGWQRPDHDDSGWAPAMVLAPYGQGPWGTGVTVAVPELPAPLLRREFTLRKPVARARLHISGLAYYDAEINGRRVGRQVLDPGFTDYDETVLYAVHDVTDHLERGANAIGVTLGRGFYGMTTPNVWNWHRPPWHGEPRLLAQLEIDHPDGSRTTVGDRPRLADHAGPDSLQLPLRGRDLRRAPCATRLDQAGLRRPRLVRRRGPGGAEGHAQGPAPRPDRDHRDDPAHRRHGAEPRRPRRRHGAHARRLDPAHRHRPRRDHGPADPRREAEGRRQRARRDRPCARAVPDGRVRVCGQRQGELGAQVLLQGLPLRPDQRTAAAAGPRRGARPRGAHQGRRGERVPLLRALLRAARQGDAPHGPQQSARHPDRHPDVREERLDRRRPARRPRDGLRLRSPPLPVEVARRPGGQPEHGRSAARHRAERRLGLRRSGPLTGVDHRLSLRGPGDVPGVRGRPDRQASTGRRSPAIWTGRSAG